MDQFGSTSSFSTASAHLAAIVESSVDAIISKNADGVILSWNQGAERVYGYAAQDVIGKSMTILLPPDKLNEEHDILARLRKGEHVSHFETVRVRKDGSPIHVSLTISPVRASDGTVIGASHVARDVTERRKLEEQLREAQKLESLGVLAAGIAHDFNNMLTGILGNASIMAEILPVSSPVDPMLREITAASQRLSDLTRQLLAYAGKGTFVVGPVSLSDLVREISALVRASVPREVQVRLKLDQNLPSIHADSSQIQQVIMNLIVNGAEAIPAGESGTVTVTTTLQNVDEQYSKTVFSPDDIRPGQFVCLEVHDTGKGMSEETLARIFEPFFTTKAKGRGLGLAAVLGIIRSNGGGLKVYSGLGRGTTFKVLFPAVGGASVGNSAVTAQNNLHPELRGQGTILVIDDEASVRGVVKNGLELYGYSVIVSEGGEQGLRAFEDRSSEIRAVLLDLSMPNMGGEEVFRRLRTLRPDVRVILSSGYGDSEALAQFAGKGLSGFLKKPFTVVQLAQAIHVALQ